MLHPEALHIFLRTTLPATLALCPIKTGKERTKPFESFWFPSQDSSPKSANMVRFAQLVSVLPARASSHEAGPKCRHGQPLTVNQWAFKRSAVAKIRQPQCTPLRICPRERWTFLQPLPMSRKRCLLWRWLWANVRDALCSGTPNVEIGGPLIDVIWWVEHSNELCSS